MLRKKDWNWIESKTTAKRERNMLKWCRQKLCMNKELCAQCFQIDFTFWFIYAYQCFVERNKEWIG